MTKWDANTKAFFKLVRAGLWVNGEIKSPDPKIQGDVDWEEVYRLATEQSALGLVLAGIEYLPIEQRPPKVELLQWIGEIQMLEQQNQAMNKFIGELVEKMRVAGIYTLLVKGQGVAQCYEKPLWRSCGDVDLLLDNDNYQKAKVFLSEMADHVDEEDKEKLHLGMTIDSWVVELHGTMRTQISSRMNRGIDEVHHDLFYGGNVRSWMNDGIQVFLPGPNNDVLLIFTHFLQHFFIGGVGLRQICDWCRLLWTYKDSLNHELLGKRIKKMGLMSEWKAFGSFAVEYLGMPVEALPFYDVRLKKKARGICEVVLNAGNFGHNQDYSYRQKYSGLRSYLITFFRRLGEFGKIVTIFPVDAPKFFAHYITNRFVAKVLK